MKLEDIAKHCKVNIKDVTKVVGLKRNFENNKLVSIDKETLEVDPQNNIDVIKYDYIFLFRGSSTNYAIFTDPHGLIEDMYKEYYDFTNKVN